MQATDQIKEKAKSSTIVQTTANVPLKAITSLFQVPTVSNNNISFSYLSNTLQRTITSTPWNSDAETSQLIKEGRYLNCKGREHTMLNCPQKAKISVITNSSHVDDIENIDQKKE